MSFVSFFNLSILKKEFVCYSLVDYSIYNNDVVITVKRKRTFTVGM